MATSRTSQQFLNQCDFNNGVRKPKEEGGQEQGSKWVNKDFLPEGKICTWTSRYCCALSRLSTKEHMWPRGNKLIAMLVSNIASNIHTQTHTHTHTHREFWENVPANRASMDQAPQFSWVTTVALISCWSIESDNETPHTATQLHTHSNTEEIAGCLVFLMHVELSQRCSNQCNTTFAPSIHREGRGFIYDSLTLWSSSISQLKQLVCFPSAPDSVTFISRHRRGYKWLCWYVLSPHVLTSYQAFMRKTDACVRLK